MRSSSPAILAILLLVLCLTGCSDTPQAGEKPAEEAAEDAIAVELGPVSRGTLSSVYSTSATLRADKQATVAARTRGVVHQLLAEEGDWVKQNQSLAILENDEQRIAFEQASANSENRRREYERAESLHRQELMSDVDYEAARRQAVEAEHTASLAELALSRTIIRATFSGRVLIRHLDVGAAVNDGTPVYDIADLDPLYVDAQVPERQVAQLQPGQSVRLLADDDNPAGEAAIERIAPAVDPSTGTVKVTLAVRRAGELRPGGFVRVGIVTDTHEHVLVVPRSALVAEGRRWHLFRIAEDGKHVELLEVSRGFEEADLVEILVGEQAERQLREGDRVVVAGASSLDDGSAVEVVNEAADEAA
jgi:membrane fusion protein (multidrug efflux system)